MGILLAAGDFPCLRAYFHLDRRLRGYMLTTYLPSFLVVLLSWLSFWIDFESAPARTSLSILTILTITTQTSALLQSTPAAATTKVQLLYDASGTILYALNLVDPYYLIIILHNKTNI